MPVLRSRSANLFCHPRALGPPPPLFLLSRHVQVYQDSATSGDGRVAFRQRLDVRMQRSLRMPARLVPQPLQQPRPAKQQPAADTSRCFSGALSRAGSLSVLFVVPRHPCVMCQCVCDAMCDANLGVEHCAQPQGSHGCDLCVEVMVVAYTRKSRRPSADRLSLCAHEYLFTYEYLEYVGGVGGMRFVAGCWSVSKGPRDSCWRQDAVICRCILWRCSSGVAPLPLHHLAQLLVTAFVECCVSRFRDFPDPAKGWLGGEGDARVQCWRACGGVRGRGD